jgi:hypothetical protein
MKYEVLNQVRLIAYDMILTQLGIGHWFFPLPITNYQLPITNYQLPISFILDYAARTTTAHSRLLY